MSKKNAKKESYLPGWGDWSFINPYWIIILAIVFYGIQALAYSLVGYHGISITDGVALKRAFTGSNHILEITGINITAIIFNLIVIIAIVYISAWLLPNGRKHERLRFAGLFVLVGSVLKLIYSFANLRMMLNLEIGDSFKLPMPTCADLYILGGLIAILIIFAKNYSDKDLEEIRKK